MELQEIRYFLALARTLNFTRAAEQCHVTQPALTRAIHKIEAELGGPLFARERGKSHLTPLGRLVEPEFREILARADAARQVADRFARLEQARLALGVMRSVGPARFVDLLAGFTNANPGVEFHLCEQDAAQLTEMLLGGELEVAVMAPPADLPPTLRADRLYAERLTIGCAPGHRFASQVVVELRDLHGETLLDRVGCDYARDIAARLEALGARPVVRWRSEREDWIQGMVRAGLGVCCLTEFSAAAPGVLMRPIVTPQVSRDVCLVTVAGRRWSPPVAAFVKVVRAHAWQHRPPATALEASADAAA
jgi:DNA-binding transcriptional LysR family regulator